MPALGANAANWVGRRACLVKAAIAAALAVRAPSARTVHGSCPRVKATVLFAIFGRIIVAETVCSFVVQVLGHPRLSADFHRLVSQTVRYRTTAVHQ